MSDEKNDRLTRVLDGYEAAILAADDDEFAGDGEKARQIIDQVLKAHRYGIDGRRAPAPRIRARGSRPLPRLSARPGAAYPEVRASFSAGEDQFDRDEDETGDPTE